MLKLSAEAFTNLLDGDRWLEHGRHANEMARRLAKGAGEIPGVEITQDVAANAVFAKLPRDNVKRLQHWSPFYTWAAAPPGGDRIDEVRWMTSFETTEESVDRFVAGIAAEMVGA